jgi:hypothetical protein
VHPANVARSFVTPLFIILSERERTRPWLVYFNPGFVFLHFLQNFPLSLLAKSAGLRIETDLTKWADMPWSHWALFIAWQAAFVALAAPLDAITTRLSIQNDLAEFAAVREEKEKMAAEPAQLERCAVGSDVIRYRSGRPPYKGVLDCARRMAQEEGYSSLYRGWWFTLYGNIVKPA